MRNVSSWIPRTMALTVCFAMACSTVRWQAKGSDLVNVKSSTELMRPPTTHLLAVGIVKYEKPLTGLDTDLFGADLDAERVSHFFESAAGGAIPRNQRHELPNERATREGILRELSSIASESAPTDTVIVFLSLHSILYQSVLYFCPYDTDEHLLQDKGLKYSDLRSVLGPRRRLLLIVDSCHAGALESEEIDSNVTVLAAARKDELAEQHQDIGGLFTHYLLSGLADPSKDLNSDGKITAGEIQKYLEQEVPKHRRKVQDQEPLLLGDASQVLAYPVKTEIVTRRPDETPSSTTPQATYSDRLPLLFPELVDRAEEQPRLIVKKPDSTWVTVAPFVPSILGFSISAVGFVTGAVLGAGIGDPRNAAVEAKLIGGTWAALGFGSVALVTGLALLPRTPSPKSTPGSASSTPLPTLEVGPAWTGVRGEF